MNKLITLAPEIKQALQEKADAEDRSLKKYIELRLAELANGELISIKRGMGKPIDC